LKALADNLEKWNKYPWQDMWSSDQTARMPYLSETEKLKVFETARKHIPAGKPSFGRLWLRNRPTARSSWPAGGGPRGGRSAVHQPCYYKSKMDNAGLGDYYTKIADACPIPISMYNMPANTGVDLSVELW